MSYGGTLKKVFRVVVPIAVSFIPGVNAIAVALSAAAATAATGGSFKESLIAGGTSFIGQSIGSSLSQSLGDAGTLANVSSPGASALAQDVASAGFDTISTGLATTPSFTSQLLSNVPKIGALASTLGEVAPGFANLADDAAGFFGDTAEGLGITGIGALQSFGDMTLAELGGKVVGALVAADLNLTVNEALAFNPQLLSDSGAFTPEAVAKLSNAFRTQQLDDVFTGLQTNVANPGFDEEEFSQILAGGIQGLNTQLGPDITQNQFDAIFGDAQALGTGILQDRFTTDLGGAFPNITAGQDPFTFGTPFGQSASQTSLDSLIEQIATARTGLDTANTEAARLDPAQIFDQAGNLVAEGTAAEDANKAFTPTLDGGILDAILQGLNSQDFTSFTPSGPNQERVDTAAGLQTSFDDLLAQQSTAEQSLTSGGNDAPFFSDDLIAQILDEQQGVASQEIANFSARGNLNATGGVTANDFIQGQREAGETRLGALTSSVTQSNAQDVRNLFDTGQQSIANFQASDAAFPFDLGGITAGRQTLGEAQQSSFGQDVRDLLGNERLFNIPDALSAGGRSQGVVSGQLPNLALDALAGRRRDVRNDRRGLGTQGVF